MASPPVPALFFSCPHLLVGAAALGNGDRAKGHGTLIARLAGCATLAQGRHLAVVLHAHGHLLANEALPAEFIVTAPGAKQGWGEQAKPKCRTSAHPSTAHDMQPNHRPASPLARLLAHPPQELLCLNRPRLGLPIAAAHARRADAAEVHTALHACAGSSAVEAASRNLCAPQMQGLLRRTGPCATPRNRLALDDLR